MMNQALFFTLVSLFTSLNAFNVQRQTLPVSADQTPPPQSASPSQSSTSVAASNSSNVTSHSNSSRGFVLNHQIDSVSIEKQRAEEKISYNEFPSVKGTTKNKISSTGSARKSTKKAHHPHHADHKATGTHIHHPKSQSSQKYQNMPAGKPSRQGLQDTATTTPVARNDNQGGDLDTPDGQDAQPVDDGTSAPAPQPAQFQIGGLNPQENTQEDTGSQQTNDQDNNQQLPQLAPTEMIQEEDTQPEDQGDQSLPQDQTPPQTPPQTQQDQAQPQVTQQSADYTSPYNQYQTQFTTQPVSYVATTPVVLSQQPPNPISVCPSRVESSGCFNYAGQNSGLFPTLVTTRTQGQGLEEFFCACGYIVNQQGWTTYALTGDMCYSGPGDINYQSAGESATCVNEAGTQCETTDVYCEGSSDSMSVYTIVTAKHRSKLSKKGLKKSQ